MTCRLDGKVAIVTGAAGGLGRAYALALAEAGAAVVINDIAGDGAEAPDLGAVVRSVRAGGGRALGILASVAEPAGVQRLVDQTVAGFGRLDIIVNNAGIVRSRPIVEMSDADFDGVIAVHLRGTFLCTRAALRAMRGAGRGGRIINVTSGAAFDVPHPTTANYAAAKGGIISFTRVAAAEGRACGVTCNAIAPLARTRMSAQYLGDDADPALDPSAVAPWAVFLASDAAAGVNGEVFRVARGAVSIVRATVGTPMQPTGERWTAEEIAARIGEILRPRSGGE